ncbi:hypothetical protein [Actinomadura sp. SCN-SB]|uniref:hypothetical protein n=1 Tax=Actinomadura sp. SCN-SB TaxID=3373092 RepID=UPI003750B4C1
MSSTPTTNQNPRSTTSTSTATPPQWPNALKVAENTFKLLTTGPGPLALDGRELGHGLPARKIDLAELRDRLLAKTANDAFKDAVWAELVTRSRTGKAAWTIGCIGVAMPGLKRIAAREIEHMPPWSIRDHLDDLVSQLLTEFVAQLPHIDLQRPNIAPRLLFAAHKKATRALRRGHRYLPSDPALMPTGATSPPIANPDPEDFLKRAVHREIISPAAASLITATRLNGRTVQELSREQGIPSNRLYRQRAAAETSLVDALRTGRLSATPPN